MTVCALMLLGGFLLKARCTRVAWDGDQYARLCYNDIQPLYGARGIDRNEFPYVDGGLRAGELEGGAIEYPVLTGLFMWASGTLVSTADSYLVVSALLLAPLGLLVAYLLYRMVGARALLWAGAPAIVLYAFHNWDLLVVASAVAGIYAWRSRKDLWAALWFGVGGGFKLLPILFVASLVVE